MPKLKKGKNESKNMEFRAIICYHMQFHGVLKTELAKILGLSYSGFYKKMQDPSRFTLLEMRIIKSRLNIPPEQFHAVI